MNNTVVIDTETERIQSRPDYPPKAVGVAIKHGAYKEYLAFGHSSGNNCTKVYAEKKLRSLLHSGAIPVFHNADFDIEVLAKTFNINIQPPYHDTMRLAFLNEPRSRDLGLKPQAEQYLSMPPNELNVLKDYVLSHIKPKRKGEWAEFIPQVPGNLVGKYAIGDVVRTERLLKLFLREISEAGMTEAYKREMALIPIKLEMEQFGIKVRLAKLKREYPTFLRLRDKLGDHIRKRLKVGADFNVDSRAQLAGRLVSLELLDNIVLTKTGKVSTKRALLEQNCNDKKLTQLLAVYGTLQTYIGTFLEPWIDRAERNHGYVQPSFNTVRSSADEFGGGGESVGTRTGRFSSSDPNFQNIPSNVEDSPHRDTLLLLRKMLAEEGVDFIGMRDYFCPDDGCVFLRRDYSQQELRILAHFEEGAFLQMYMDDPTMDAHDAVKSLVLTSSGLDYPRKHIKQTNFGVIYGMGLRKLAGRLDIDLEEAKKLRGSVLRAIPGVKTLMNQLKEAAANGEPFYTWGGRRYYCEEPLYVETEDGGREKRTFEYKMLNTKIQGSAADCTKDGMINTHERLQHSRIVLQVHDELLVSCPKEHAKAEMMRMKQAMEDVKFKVPMLTDGEMGGISWARLKKCV